MTNGKKKGEAMGSKFINNIGKVLSEVDKSTERALTKVGLAGETYAKKNLTEFPRVDTGRLRNSMTNTHSGKTVVVGTNVEYAPEVEYGTQRMEPSHFLGNAMTDHVDEYKKIFENELKK